jgi:nitrogen fixation NifU-like protein
VESVKTSAAVDQRARDLPFAGRLDASRDDVGTGVVEDRAHAVVLRLQLSAPGDRVESACFFAYGCPSAIAAASWAAEWMHGKGLDPAPDPEGLATELAAALALPPAKHYAAELAALALLRAIGDRRSKR